MPNTAAGLIPAREVAVSKMSDKQVVVEQLEQLHSLVLDVCPDCLATQRRDGALIYVPPNRRHATTNKNLLTLWARPFGARMRIMPDPEEMYDANHRTSYRRRLTRLYAKLLGREDCG